MYTPNNLNLYHYGNNNPLKFKDPDGRFWGLAVKAAGAFFRTPLGRRAAIYLAAQAAKYLQEPLQKAGEYAEEKNREAGDYLSEKINDLNNAMAKDEATPQEELDEGGASAPNNLEEPPDDERPERESNRKHHPNSESPEPKNVDELYNNSIKDEKGKRWAKDENDFLHRFSKPSNGKTHWNGSTRGKDPIRKIPKEIHKTFRKYKIEKE